MADNCSESLKLWMFSSSSDPVLKVIGTEHVEQVLRAILAIKSFIVTESVAQQFFS